MYVSKMTIENFRCFGENDDRLEVEMAPGITALVGENDAGKTAIIDALRLLFGTRDQEYVNVRETDFHQKGGDGGTAEEIRIRCRLDGLSLDDKAAFVEHLTYNESDSPSGVSLYLTWTASWKKGTRVPRSFFYKLRSGQNGDGPEVSREAREELRATYLRPLRDAERSLSAGRRSRLSEILKNTPAVREKGISYRELRSQDGTKHLDDAKHLSLLGISEYTNELLADHEGIRCAQDELNQTYLNQLSLADDPLMGHISVGNVGNEDLRLRQLLEKLELDIRNPDDPDYQANRGLGSNNLLFIACELLLLETEATGFSLLLMEEPEAHLHPQRQLRLMRFLISQTESDSTNGDGVQVIITTHSPNLASAIPLKNLVYLHARKAFSLGTGKTRLCQSDYTFLERFLDVTKANLFFARGVLIVEGAAESILLPALARILDRDLHEFGVSIVNVGSTGLRRYSRIFMRRDEEMDGVMEIKVACIADFDVMPDCAPGIVGIIKPGEIPKCTKNRRWRMRRDFVDGELEKRRSDMMNINSNQYVRTFVSDHWTLEYDLAFAGFSKEVYMAAYLAK